MIPKVLHYCWFGGGAMPSQYEAYITEWKDLHPGWEIKRWDETNSPLDLPYLQKAMSQKKWANMSNLVRFYALMNEGGIYLDTDMKVIKPLDSLLANECFLGFEEGESVDAELWVNNAVIGAEKNNAFIHCCYETLLADFDGSEDANLSAPRLVTKLLKEQYGLTKYGYQVLQGVALYPQAYFYPVHYNEPYKLSSLSEHIDETTVAVHMWGRSWLTSEQLMKMLDDLRYQYNIMVDRNHQYQTAWSTFKTAGDTLSPESESGEPGNVKPFLLHEIREQIALIGDKIGAVHEHYTRLTNEIEKLVSGQNSYEEKIEEKEHLIGELRIQVEENNKLLNDKLEIIAGLQTKYQSAKLEFSTALGELKTENALLKQDVGSKEARTAGLEGQIEQLAVHLRGVEIGMQSQIRLLTEQKEDLRQSLAEKVAQLEDSASLLEKTLGFRDQLMVEKAALESVLGQKEQQISNTSFEVELLQKEKALLITEAKLSEVERQKERKVLEEATCRLAFVEREYIDYKVVQERNASLLEKTLASREQLMAEKAALVSALDQQEKQISSACLEMKLLQKERAQLITDTELREGELQRERLVAQESTCRITLLEREYADYRATQEQNNAELIALLQNRVDNCNRAIQWYQATYENRKLWGIIKDKLLKSLYILKR